MNHARKLLLLGLILATAVLSVTTVRWQRRPAPLSLRFAFVPGETLTYAFNFVGTQVSTSESNSAKQRVESKLSVDADLIFSVRAAGLGGEHDSLLVLSVGEIRHWQQAMLGTTLISTADAARPWLKGAEAFVSIDDTGHIRAVHYPAAASPLFRSFIQTALTETQVVLGSGPDWTAIEDSPSARVATSYQVTSHTSLTAGTAPIVIEKRFVGVEALHALKSSVRTSSQVEGTVEVRIEPHGYLAEVSGERRLRALDDNRDALLFSETKFSLVKVNVRRDATTPAAPALAGLDRMAPGDAVKTEQNEHEALVRRIAGLTGQGLVEGVRTRAEHHDQDHNTWLWRAVGLIRLDETVVDELETAFRDPALGPSGRALIVDLLAGAATVRAQDGMRRLLEAARTERARDAASLLNHVALVARPTPQTVTFVAERYQMTEGPERLAAAMVLGGIARQLASSGDTAGAARIAQQLGEALGRASSQEEREALVLALGNTAASTALPSIVALTHDPDASLRKSAVSALRRIESPATRRLLFDLAADNNASVQREAIRVLGGYALTAPDIRELEAMIASRRIRDAAYGEILNVVSILEHKFPREVLAVADEIARHPIYGQVSSRTRELQARAAGQVLPCCASQGTP